MSTYNQEIKRLVSFNTHTKYRPALLPQI